MGVGRRTLGPGLAGAALSLILALVGNPAALAAELPPALPLREIVVELDLAGGEAPPGSPPGLSATFRLAAGDVFGEGRAALAVLRRIPGGAGHQLQIFRPGAVSDNPVALVPVPGASREIPDLLADGLVAADVTGNGRDEVWLGHSPSLGCLEWDGAQLQPLQPWKFWQNKPVTVGRLAGPAGAPDLILALGAWYSPEVGVGLISGWWRDKMWGKAVDLRASDFFCPGDRATAADVDGDGTPELLLAPSSRREVLPRQPFTVARLREPQDLAALEGLFPEAVAAADLDGNGIPEIYLAENLRADGGEPPGSRVLGLVWTGSELTEVFRRDFPLPVADLTAGDFDGDGRLSLVVGLVRPAGATPYLTLAVLRLRGEGDLGW